LSWLLTASIYGGTISMRSQHQGWMSVVTLLFVASALSLCSAIGLAQTGARRPAATPTSVNVKHKNETALVHRATTAPTIDGNMDAAWANAVTYPLPNYLVGGTPPPGDLAGSFRLLYDSQRLYVLVEIIDNSGQNDSSDTWWEDDSIEIYIDGDHSRGSRYDGVNDFQFGFRWHDDTIHTGSNSAAAPGGIQAAHIDTHDGDRLEVAFPLAGLGISAVDGYQFGLEVHRNDDDDGGVRDRKLTWHGTVDDAWENPSGFGTAQLVRNATATPTATPTVAISATPTKTPQPTPSPTASQATWQPAGFGGAGAFVTVHFDPTQAGVVYVTSDVAGVFRSGDGGSTWTMRSLGLGNYEVSSFALDPFDANTLYAGVGAFANSSKAGIYVSRDAGLSWQHLSNTAANGIDFRIQRTVNAIAPDPHHQGVLVTGSRSNGLWRSTNGGVTWTQVFTPPTIDVPPFNSTAGAVVVDGEGATYPAPVTVVRFAPNTPDLVYAGVYGVGVLKSSAGGVAGSWQPVNSGLPAQPTLHDLVIASDGALYLAAGQAGVYKSSNGGTSWQVVNGNLPVNDVHVLSLAVHPTDRDTVYLAQERTATATTVHEAIWRTTDGGASWREVVDNIAPDPVHSPPDAWWFYPSQSWRVAVDPHDPDWLFYLLGGIYRSTDGGTNWQNVIKGAQDTCVTDLLVDTDHPANQPDTLFATHMDAGLLASTDNGASWHMVSPTTVAQRDALAGHYWRIMLTKADGAKRYYTVVSPWARDYAQILRSSDGVNWQAVFTDPTPNASRGLGQSSLAADPSQPGVLYFAQDGGVIFQSTDHGDTWQQTPGQPEGAAFNDLLVDEAGRLFAATFWQGLWRSNDGGATWGRVFDERWLFGRLAHGGGAIYAGTEDGNLYRSRDGGTTWVNLTNVPAEEDSDGNGVYGVAVAVNPADPDHLLFSRADGWHSSDAGGGLLESRDGGQSWVAFNAGLGYPRANVLAFGSSDHRFAGTFCGGIWATTGQNEQSTERGLFLPVVTR